MMDRVIRAGALMVLVVYTAGKPTSYKENLIDSDISKTVEEVVEILGRRPDLPRLTRGEILELVADVRRQKSLDDSTVKKTQEPLVVVMPFRANGTSIEELYTQAPVTQVIGDLVTKLATKRPGYKRRRKPIPRPVYVSTEATTPVTELPVTTPVQPVSNIQKIPPKVTTPPTTTTEKSWKPLEELAIPDEMKDVIEEMTVKPQTVKPTVTVPATRKPTTKPVVPPEDVSVAAESLSDEMKDLLTTFGLLGTNKGNETPVDTPPKDPYSGFEFGSVKPKVDPNSYISFKPLPEGGDDGMTPDMKEFLASFGLIDERGGRSMKSEPSGKQKRSKDRENRTLKEMKQDEIKINAEMFSDDMMSVLENLGIAKAEGSRKAKRLGEHIFNPAQRTAELNNTDQIEKVHKLVTKIKELSENHEIHSLTPTELSDILKTEAELIQLGGDGNLLVKTGTLDNPGGPDPLSLDEIVELLDKNESKRQDSSEETSSTEAITRISTRRYDTSDNITYTDSGKENIEDSTQEQSMNGTVTIPPEEPSSSEESSSQEELSSSESGSSASATAASSSSDSSSSAASSSASSTEERASSSASSSSSGGGSSSASASADASSSSSSASASADASSSSASAETDNQPAAAEGPSFDDLNDSFGGVITTTARPNGLFFLLDWNSFLQVGTEERKVDLTFNPKIGDPRNFYPIKFP